MRTARRSITTKLIPWHLFCHVILLLLSLFFPSLYLFFRRRPDQSRTQASICESSLLLISSISGKHSPWQLLLRERERERAVVQPTSAPEIVRGGCPLPVCQSVSPQAKGYVLPGWSNCQQFKSMYISCLRTISLSWDVKLWEMRQKEKDMYAVSQSVTTLTLVKMSTVQEYIHCLRVSLLWDVKLWEMRERGRQIYAKSQSVSHS